MTVVLASGAAALAGEQAEKSCAETLSSASHIHQCLVLVRNSWTKKKKLLKKNSPCTQSSDRSGLSGEDEIIYKLGFNVPVSSFFFLTAATSPPSVTVV